MKIQVAERLKPFSHQPGTSVVLPRSQLVIKIFPTLIKVEDRHIPLEVSGPVKAFTVQLDLERGCVWVWGVYKEGYHRYRLWSEAGEFRMTQVRGSGKEGGLFAPSKEVERLSLGSHKKQDWCLVRRRGDLKEIVPQWMRLAQFLPMVEHHTEGTVGCLSQIPMDKNTLYEDILNLFFLGFDGILNPHLEDSYHLGISVPPVNGTHSSLALITQGAEFLRELFVKVKDQVSILPCLPPQFHCGRFISIDLGVIGKLDIEWTKKMVRRMVFYSAADQERVFSFSKEVKNFRLKVGDADKGKACFAGDILSFHAQTTYFFDRFQK